MTTQKTWPSGSVNLSVVVPCYWVTPALLKTTKDCLYSMHETTGQRIDEVIIVDDGSPIEALDELRDLYTMYCQHELNSGYASAVNTGLEVAQGEVIIVANNDLVFIQPDWLEQLLKPIYDDEADISLIAQTDTDGWSVDARYTHTAKFGALWAMTREAYEKLGNLDERFGKGYFDDLDYWHRAQDAGLSIIKNHAGLVEHIGKQTFKTIDPKDMLFGKNMFKYKEKWGDAAYLIETEPNKIILMDKYEFLHKTKAEQSAIKKLSVTLTEARQRWSNA